MKREDIRIRDPFVLAYDNVYYMYASADTSIKSENDRIREKSELALLVYKSNDMENWSEPEVVFSYIPSDTSPLKCDLWAPEVHFYNGRFYAFLSFRNSSMKRGTYVAQSNTPDGEFKLLNDFPVTPFEKSCIDGTLYVEDGIPYVIYSHDWPDCCNEETDICVGEICARRLTDDLKEGIGDAFRLFASDESEVVKKSPNHLEWEGENYVRCGSDGPFVVKREDGKLLVFWSPMLDETYVVMCAVSESGKLKGPWKHITEPIFSDNGGHPMVFEDFDGKTIMCIHQPEKWFDERMHYFHIDINKMSI